MKDKQYYIDLTERYFDAETSVAEEKELRAFLAETTDEDFNEVKAVMGFMLESGKRQRWAHRAGSPSCSQNRGDIRGEVNLKVSGSKFQGSIRRLSYAAAAAVVAMLVLVPFVKGGNSDCMMIAEGETTTNNEEVINEMDKEMAMLFSTEDDNSMENDMALIFN